MKKSTIQSVLFATFILGYTTFNASAQWKWQDPKPTGNPLLSIFFISSLQGWTVRDNGTILTTNNGGTNLMRPDNNRL